MKRTSILSAAILAAALPLMAQGQDAQATAPATPSDQAAPAASAPVPGENFLSVWDTDGDGKVTLEEALARRGDLFDSFDADENGQLTPDELADLAAMRDAMRDSMRGSMGGAQDRPAGDDCNGPRGGEHRGGGHGWGHGSGWGPQGGMRHGEHGGGHGWGRGWGQAPQGRPAPQGGPGMMAPGGKAPGAGMMGLGGDGQISRDAFIEAGKAWFERFDRNNDGAVTVDDFPMKGRGGWR